ncbi:immunoglobulin-like domain-containing protein [Listeria newyorkensis]|uniref:BIG2 domain-containing protein n=1 Tax=Listeria newyorkensis TaxID=1497681 RepID=A0A841Z306_9LIST|nr:immunoglobulin-like domain-containing protein [Listeria newyorkensis]MBC1459237.1 hypothetical protein [Listeria newyorkensis]
MKSNMKKIAIALVATNVVASTLITTLPPVQTHAAEEKLTSNLKATSSATLDYMTVDTKQVTGHAPSAVGSLVTVERIQTNVALFAHKSEVLTTYTGVVNSDGNYAININPMGYEDTVRVTFANGESITQNVSVGNMATFKVNPINPSSSSVITGSFSGHSNVQIKMDTLIGANTFFGKIDSQGNFSIPLGDYRVSEFDSLRFTLTDNEETFGVWKDVIPATLPDLPAVSFNVTGLDTKLSVGATGKISTSISPVKAGQSVTYSSSNSDVLKVDANGNWTALAYGSAQVSVTSPTDTNGVLTKIIPVTVIADTGADAARTSVNDLFINNNPANHIKDTTNQATIDAAQAKVNAIINDPTSKNELQAYVTKAQNELNARNTEAANQAAAITSVNDLFVNNNPANHIKDTTNQAAIDAAQAKVNLVSDATKKAELQGQVDKAKSELAAKDTSAKVAEATANFHGFSINTSATAWIAKIDEKKKSDYEYNFYVNGSYVASWYTSGSSTYSSNSTDGIDRIITANYTFKEGDILTAKASVDGKLYTVGELKISLYDDAKAVVNALFINNDPANHIKDTTNQAAIDAAQAKVNLVSDATKKAELQGQVDKAKAELAAKNAMAAATTAVNNLFSNAPTNTVLKDTTTQAMIDAASALVNALPASADKTKLAGDVTTANTLFNQIATTSIGALTTDSTTVSGKGEPNAAIIIKNGATTIASGKVASDGNYSFTIAQQPANSTITATVTKASNGKTSSASTIVKDEAIVSTTINALTTDSTSVSGKGEPNADIVIKNGATTIASGKVAGDGNYLFFIPTQAAGSSITATVTKTSNGKMSSATTTIVDNSIVTTTIDALTTESTTVSGKGEPNADIVIKNGNTTISTGKVASDGTYYFNIAKQAAGSTITATVTKASNGKTSSANATIADDTIAQTTVGTLNADSTTVSGVAEPNSAIVIKNGSTTIASGTVASNGTYQLTIAKQAAGSVIIATATKASNGKTSSASTTVAAVTVDYSLKANSYKIGTANLTGTYGKNISKVRLFVNGTLIVQATTSNGTFTFANIASYITKPTDKVEVVGVDGAYVERARVAVTVTGDPVYDYSLSANDYTLGNATLTGKYGKDVSKVRLWVNNVVVAQATTNADGTYSFDKVPSFVKLATDKVEVVGVNAAYNEVARKTVVTKGTSILDTSITPNSYAKDSANLTGTYGKDISKVRLWVNGVVVAQASTSGTNFTFTNIASFIKNKTDLVEVVGVDAQYKELNRKTVTLTGFDTLDNSLTAPTDFTLNKDTAINGTFGTNVSKVRLSVNGVIVKQAATTGNTYSITGANAYITKTTDVVKIIGVDAQYKEVSSKTITVKADSTVYDYKLVPNTYTFGDATITGTYGADIGSVRLSVNGNIIKAASLNNGNFTLNGLASITSPTDLVEIVAVNANYKEVARVTIQPK